ncbi:MAG: GNAT family N-acetyltransferase [Balneolaceae bacterium]|nr:GNAT family N-acetyltransferase [Balneolaceae bacterium]
MSDLIQFRTLKTEDIPFAMKLKRQAGWNQLEEDWEFLINAGGKANLLATYNDKKAGTATTINYQKRFSWIGMVLVEPDYRGNGIGRALLSRSIEHAATMGTVRLDATPQGKKLYDTMGFKTESELARFECSEVPDKLPGPNSDCRLITKNDLKNLLVKDAQIFGANREPVLNYFYKNSPDYAFVALNNEGEISGYCFGRSGSEFEQIGPIVAETVESAEDVLLSSMENCKGKKVITDAFTKNQKWIDFLEKAGFSVQRPFFRMFRGKLKYPGKRELQFAAAAPEFG